MKKGFIIDFTNIICVFPLVSQKETFREKEKFHLSILRLYFLPDLEKYVILMDKLWNYNIRRTANSGFSIVTMRWVTIIFFELGVVKNFIQEFLMTRHFMIISLFKNCAWLWQLHLSIESFKRYMFYKTFYKKFHQFQTAITFANLIPFIPSRLYKLEKIIRNSC